MIGTKRLAVSLRRSFHAIVVMITLRLLDPGKWSDCDWLIDMVGKPGLVVNMSGLIRPWGGTGIFEGVKVIALPNYEATPAGMITVSSGADSGFNCGAAMADLMEDKHSGDIILATLSQLDLASAGYNSMHLIVNGAIGPGASTGTSASVQVGLLRALTLPEVSPDVIAMSAVDAQLRKCKQPTGVQDHFAAARGSALKPASALKIEIEHFPNANVTPLSVGGNVRAALESACVLTFIGSHSSGEEHRKARTNLESDMGLAEEAHSQMIAAANATEAAIVSDNVLALANAMDATTVAHRLIHPDLVGSDAAMIMSSARMHGAIGAMLPGAGGNGGSVVSLFDTREQADAFVAAMPGYRHYELKLVG